MALTNYGQLKTAVAAWLNKTNLTSVIPDFIALAEQDMRIDCRVQAMETLVTGTLSGETLAHPTNYVDAKRLVVADIVYDYVTPAQYEAATSDAYVNSRDYVFTSIGDDFYISNGVSGDSYSLVYSAGFTALSADGDTNWILTNAPDVYLAGACRYGSAYLKDDAAEQRYAARYVGAVARVNAQQRKAAHPGALLVRAG